MRWSERLKLTWQTFLREAPALYLWFLIYILVMAVVTVIFVFSLIYSSPVGIPSSAFLHRPPVSPVPYAPFPGGNLGGNFAYGTPIAPIPFSIFGGRLPLLHNPTLLLPYLGHIAWAILGLMLITFVASAGLTAGVYHLTWKALKGEKPSFRDFKFNGTLRIIGWFCLILLAQLVVIAVAVLGSLLFHSIKILLAIFLVVYVIAMAALAIYLVPWLASGQVYLLAQREQRFWQAFRSSFTFFRRHMGILWGYIGTTLLILIGLFIVNRISPILYLLASLAVAPFNMMLPMVWVLSLLEEEAIHSSTGPMDPLPPAAALTAKHPVPETQYTPDTSNSANPNTTDTPGTLNATDMPDTTRTTDTPAP